MPVTATVSVGLALLLDLYFGEPPHAVHPVALYGELAERLEFSSFPRLSGIVMGIILPLVAAVSSGVVVWVLLMFSEITAIIVSAVFLFSVTSLRRLLVVCMDVIQLSSRDTRGAREEVSKLVGRNTDELSEDLVRSAALESLAENYADGLVAPLLFYAVLAPYSLPLAVGGSVWVKMANTMDSMYGYKESQYGWFSARLDDFVMWVPARFSAFLIAFAGMKPLMLKEAWRWRGEPASPNSGWPMSTLAVILGVRLEKPGEYVLNPGRDYPGVKESVRGVRLVGLAGVIVYVFTGVVSWF